MGTQLPGGFEVLDLGFSISQRRQQQHKQGGERQEVLREIITVLTDSFTTGKREKNIEVVMLYVALIRVCVALIRFWEAVCATEQNAALSETT